MASTAPRKNAVADDAKADYETAKADLDVQISILRDDISQLAASMKKLASSGAGVATDRAAKHARQAEMAGLEVAGRVGEAFEQNTEQLADYARRKPMTALAFAAGAGLLIGYLTAPRR